jgi:hypothetical protein
MKRFFGRAALVAIATAAVAGIGTAPVWASPITATVDFWNYNGATIGTGASDANPIVSTTPTAVFTYSGPLNWNTSLSTNTVAQFLGADTANISGFSSGTLTLAQFLATPLSTAGDATSSFFRLTGLISSPSSSFIGSVTHDDGVTFNIGGTLAVNSPGETASNTSSFSLPSFTNQAFILDYVEGNGAPSILSLDVSTPFTTTPPVPETSTWAMMILGFLGVGFVSYRRRSHALYGNRAVFRIA